MIIFVVELPVLLSWCASRGAGYRRGCAALFCLCFDWRHCSDIALTNGVFWCAAAFKGRGGGSCVMSVGGLLNRDAAVWLVRVCFNWSAFASADGSRCARGGSDLLLD